MKFFYAIWRGIKKLIYAILTFLGGVLVLVGGLTLLGTGIYCLYIWWGVVSELGFLGLVVAVVFFMITVPLAPIYVGMHDNWEPTIFIILGIVCGLVILVIGGGIAGFALEKFDE